MPFRSPAAAVAGRRLRRPAGVALAAPLALAALLISACGGEGTLHRPGRAHRPSLVPAGLGRAAIDWSRGGTPSERLVMGENGLAAGPADGPLVRNVFRSPEEADDLRFFAASFAPFSTAGGGERFVFAGRGTATASPAERRMIREWAQKAAAEAAVGDTAGGSAYGLALAWRGGALACDGVSVFLSGEVHAVHCDWRQEVRGRLAGEPLARLYRWFDTYGPFQVDSLDAGRGSFAATGLIFAGRGALPAPPEERAAITELAAALYRELAARRAASLPPAPPARPSTQTPAQPAAQAVPNRPPEDLAPPTGPSLLRPDLPPPAPATTPILPIPPPAPASAAAITAARPVPDQETATEPPPPPAARAPAPERRAPAEEEDEAPIQGTEPPPGG